MNASSFSLYIMSSYLGASICFMDSRMLNLPLALISSVDLATLANFKFFIAGDDTSSSLSVRFPVDLGSFLGLGLVKTYWAGSPDGYYIVSSSVGFLTKDRG